MNNAFDTDILVRGVILLSFPRQNTLTLFPKRTSEDQKEMAACQTFFEMSIHRTLLYSVKEEWENNIQSKVNEFVYELYKNMDLSKKELIEKIDQKTAYQGMVEAFEKFSTETWQNQIDDFRSVFERNYLILIKDCEKFEKDSQEHEKWKSAFGKNIPELNAKKKDRDLSNLVACACMTKNSPTECSFVLLDKPILKLKQKIHAIGKYHLLMPSEVSK